MLNINTHLNFVEYTIGDIGIFISVSTLRGISLKFPSVITHSVFIRVSICQGYVIHSVIRRNILMYFNAQNSYIHIRVVATAVT